MDEKTKTLLDAIEARWRKTTPGPIDVHRIDQHDGTIAYQLQQADGAPKARTDRDDDLLIGARVLTQFDDLDNPDARWDAEACAKAYEDVPALIALVSLWRGERARTLFTPPALLTAVWGLQYLQKNKAMMCSFPIQGSASRKASMKSGS